MTNKRKRYAQNALEHEFIKIAYNCKINDKIDIAKIKELISLIKEKKLNIDTLTQKTTENTPLMIAATLGISELIAIYLNFTNVDINACQDLNYTTLMLAAQEKHLDIIEMLLSIPDINVEQKTVPMGNWQHKQFNAIDIYLYACESKNEPVNEKIMELFTHSINIYKKFKKYQKGNKDPLLIKAIEAKDIEMIKSIIGSTRNIFDINEQKSSTGDTPLMIAMHNAKHDFNFLDIIDDLLSIPTIDLTIRNHKNETVIDLFNNLKRSLTHGGMNGNSRKIKIFANKLQILEQVGQKIKTYPRDQYLLITAIKNQDLDVVKSLLAAPWKINIKHIIDDEGNTAFTLAQSIGNSNIINAINTAIINKEKENLEDDFLDEVDEDNAVEEIDEVNEDNDVDEGNLVDKDNAVDELDVVDEDNPVDEFDVVDEVDDDDYEENVYTDKIHEISEEIKQSNNTPIIFKGYYSLEIHTEETDPEMRSSSTSSSKDDSMLPPKKRKYFRDHLAANTHTELASTLARNNTKDNANLLELNNSYIRKSKVKRKRTETTYDNDSFDGSDYEFDLNNRHKNKKIKGKK